MCPGPRRDCLAAGSHHGWMVDAELGRRQAAAPSGAIQAAGQLKFLRDSDEERGMMVAMMVAR